METALLWRRMSISSAWYSSEGPIAMKCPWHNFDIGSRLIKLKYDYIKQWKEAATRTVMEWDQELKNSSKALHSSISLASFYQLSVKQLHPALLICSSLLPSFHPAARRFLDCWLQTLGKQHKCLILLLPRKVLDNLS